MNLQPMKPTPYSASGNTFKVLCYSCGSTEYSDKVLCNMDGKSGEFYCPDCVEKLLQTEQETGQ